MRQLRFLCLLALLSILSACSREPRAIYLIPHGFVGWVCVYEGDPSAPPAEAEGGFAVFRIGRDGIARTSTPGKFGTGYLDYFFYVGDDGAPTPVPPADEGGGGTFYSPSHPGPPDIFYFWIGANQSAYKEEPRDDKPPDGPPCGPRRLPPSPRRE